MSASESVDIGLRELPSAKLWRTSAPADLRNAWKQGDLDTAWDTWRAIVRQRSTGDLKSINWGLEREISEEIRSSFSDRELHASEWIESLQQSANISLQTALQAIAWAYRLPRLTASFDQQSWWRLTGVLAGLAEQTQQAAAIDPGDAEPVVVDQLLGGELPLVLSRLLGEIRPLHDLAAPSRDTLSAGIDRLTDGEGQLAGGLWTDPDLPAANLLIACWTRCLVLAEGEKKPWKAAAQTQYEWLVRQTVRLADRHGRLAFMPAKCIGSGDLLHRALELGGDESDHAAAALRLKGFQADDHYDPPTPSTHSEWAAVGVLAAGWKNRAPRMTVAHPADTMRVEIHAGKQTLLAGEWPVEATIDGVAVQSTDDWECQCWYSDEECDYLELALPLAGEARLERQLFLAREDGVGFLAETLFSCSTQQKQLTVTTRIPLGEGVSIRPERETREAMLTSSGDMVAGLIPLALPEWRDDPRGGELTAEEGALVLTRQWSGRNMASPLWFDFSPRRFGKQRTWRQLTVAQSLQKVAPDVAIGYRIQAAKQQWLVYRSLDKPGNRTVLGQNYSSEQIVGRFEPPAGTVHEYFEIEGSFE